MNPLQQKQLDVLKAFIRVCDKHNLEYFLVYGTALGAIRHKGFIPWDDDIDVGMPRKDYEKYIQLQSEYEGTPYFIQTYKSDPCYIYSYAKLRDSSTTFLENAFKNHRINHGVFIDIFPIDGMSREVGDREKIGKKNKFVWRQVYFSYLGALRRKVHKRTFFKDIGLNIVAGLFYVFDIAHYRNKRVDKFAKRIPLEEAKMAGIMFGFTWRINCMDADIFRETIKVPFEDIEVKVPKQYDKYLTNLYKDYMKFPPIEQQVGHHYNSGVSLDQGYEDYLKEHRI
ncbi:MAG: LicD family protein [Bacilli bacterium]|nr:LicD family protein [Bacilli bacterium]